MDFVFIGGNKNAKMSVENKREENGIFYADIKMTFKEATIPEQVKLRFYYPASGCYSVWSPNERYDRALRPNWRKSTTVSRLASNMPLHGLVSSDGKNKLSIALSDAKTPMEIATGVSEETACVECDITFFTFKIAPIEEYNTVLRLDMRDIPYYDSIYDVARWWENDCGYTPAYVPEHARLPMNSLWYSYHQKLDVEDIIKECELSKLLGMETVIVDDGWQTDDNGRGYACCGDWELATSKIPDMKQFVDRIHAVGMKMMLWYSVPFVGIYAKNYERFKDMILDETGNKKTYWALDPRYKEVREFLIGTYERAVREWGLDGLKLDFIDSFKLYGRSLEYDERRDHQSLEDAIDALMTEVKDRLTAIDPEILIEFRQSYVGPAIRKYGNMLRVSDCPADAIRNRGDVVNLRFTSGNTAVHSDMLMWHYDDSVESAALQLVSVLFSVPQISMKIARLNQEHKKMLNFYLAFWREHRELLLDGKLIAYCPEGTYSLVCSEKDGDAIFVAYSESVVDCSEYDRVYAVNSSRNKSLILKGADKKGYKVFNCVGDVIADGIVNGELFEISVPMSGIIELR